MLNQSSLHRYSHKESTQKNKLMHLLKRIAELELREARHVEKIRYVEAVNLRLANQKQEQLQLMQCHPTSEIETLIKNLQGEIKRLTSVSAEKGEKEKEGWIRKFEEITERSNRAVEMEREKRMELEYEIKILRQSKLSHSPSPSHPNPHFNTTIKLGSSPQLQNQKLKRQLQQYKLRNQQLQLEYNRLQQQIETKFAMLDEQITMYEKEKEESYNNICRLQEELRLRECCDGFSFSENKEAVFNPESKGDKHGDREGDGDEDMNINCYRSSIESLLQQNTRLKKSIATLEQILKDNNCEIPKQIEIELSLSRRVLS